MTTKKLREFFASLSVAALAAVIATAATHYLTFLSNLENIASDIRIAALQAPMPQSENIVIVAITEETVTQFPYRSPVDRTFLAKLLSTLQSKGAQLIGVDILFDQATEPDKDALLKQTIRDLKVPLFVSYTNTPSIVNEDQLIYLKEFVPEINRAGANLATDPFDGAVRWVFPGKTNEGMPLGFGRKAAELLGIKTPDQQVEIAWRAKPDLKMSPFPIYPSHAVAMLPDEWFKGKIVLVGAVLSITDRHRTPLAVVHDGDEGMMPGVIIQAHGVSQFVEGRKAARLPEHWIATIALIFSVIGMLIGLLKRGILFNVLSGAIVVGVLWLGAFLGYSKGVPLVPLVTPTLSMSLCLWIMDMMLGRAERKQREFVQGAFSRYVSPAVVGQLVDNPEALSISGIRREATFIFTDIAGFTTLSEKLTSDKLSDVLNAYLDGACAIILKYEGTVDKFIGDAIMSIFNAPISQADHAERAVKCALELDAYAENFRIEQNNLEVPLGVTRIGVHTGMATIGNFGSHSRMDFTALGDTVNTAARTEGVNKYFGTRLCCTEDVVRLCGNVKFMPIGDVVLKGKAVAVGLFNPVSHERAQSQFYADYMAMYDLLKKEHCSAKAAIQALYQQYPDEPLVCFHFDRIEAELVTTRVVMEDK